MIDTTQALVDRAGDPMVVGLAGPTGARPGHRARVDRLVARAASVSVLAAVVLTVYVVVVLGLRRAPAGGEWSVLELSMLAAAVTAPLYRPAGDRVVAVARRLVDGGPPGRPVTCGRDHVQGHVGLDVSRARLAAGGDAERRWIERNLHDGAQQQLVALAVKLRLIQHVAEADLEQALGMLEEARADVLATVEEVRTLAQGIYPPLLMDRGLREALQAAARRAALPTTVRADGIVRYHEDVEATVYFCCLEALQNAGKHAGEGATAEILLGVEGGELCFEVRDDGAGFDPARASHGQGVGNMADRVRAVGGSVALWSIPGQGTRVVGRIPHPDPAAATGGAGAARA